MKLKQASILIILTALLLVLIGCEQTPHTHTPTTVAAVAPTCTETGLTEGTVCADCGEILVAQEIIAATEHTPATEAAIAATCLSEGQTDSIYCSVCGEVLTAPELIPKLDHTPVPFEAIDPTCLTEGRTAGEGCSVCGEVLSESEVLPKLEHTLITLEAIAPTCHAEGLSEGEKCTVCGTVTVEQKTLARLAHVEVSVEALEPTCTTDGHSAGKKCTACNTVLAGMTKIKALGHIEVIDAAVDATYSAAGLTEGKHCSRCQAVLVAQKTVPMLEKIDGFPKGYITKAPTTLITNHLELNIHENIYVPGDLKNSINILTSVMEKVSGMKFAGNPSYAGRYSHPDATTKLTFVEVTKPIGTENELGAAYAMPSHAVISSGDLLDLSTLVHECSHTLHYRQSPWFYCQWAMEGISTYTTYKTQEYVLKHYPELVEYMDIPFQSFVNMAFDDYDQLYGHSMEYWIDNILENSGNGNYIIGFRLMWYLDETYGNYTKWIYDLEERYPAYQNMNGSDQLPKEKILEAFYHAYGESVFDDFYAWLKQNEALFETKESTVDLRDAKRFNVYPFFYFSGNRYSMTSLHFYYNHGILYRDLCIGLEEGIRYLTEYKNKSCDKLSLLVNDGVEVKVFDKDGKLLRTGSSQNIDLTDVSYVQLVGEGKLIRFEITGYQ